MRTHTLSPPHTHDRWNAALPPALEVDSGDIVEFACLDSSGAQMHPGATVGDFVQMDRGRIHTITGPVFVKDAQPGDVLEIEIREVRHRGWGWSSIIQGLGAHPERFSGPFLFHWKLEGDVTRSLPGVTVPLAPFLGILGVCPAEPGEHRTRPPGPFGGNLDVRDLVAGTRLFLPVFQPGALFSAGDGHAAQGNGEVCINGIEAPMDAVFRLTLHRGLTRREPFAELPPARPPVLPDLGSFAFIASSADPMAAVRRVIDEAVDWVVANTALSPEQAYVLCSVALDLRLSQVVNVPMITVTGTLARSMFQG